MDGVPGSCPAFIFLHVLGGAGVVVSSSFFPNCCLLLGGESDRPNCSHNVSQKVKRIRCFSEKTGMRVHSDVPPERKLERGCSHVAPERKPERGHVRQNHPFTKPPFYLPVIFGVLWNCTRASNRGIKLVETTAVAEAFEA